MIPIDFETRVKLWLEAVTDDISDEQAAKDFAVIVWGAAVEGMSFNDMWDTITKVRKEELPSV